MKTIEERVEELAESLAGFSLRKSVIKERPSQFAADLNAEKEKEVAELKAKLKESEELSAKNFIDGVRIAQEGESLLDEVKTIVERLATMPHIDQDDEFRLREGCKQLLTRLRRLP